MNNHKVCVLIAAAGMGKRMRLSQNKQYLPIHGKPMIRHTIEVFDTIDAIDKMILLIRSGEEEMMRDILDAMELRHEVSIVLGGDERQDSIWEGLRCLKDFDGIILTHDGARPFVTAREISAVIDGARSSGACCLMTPMKDTVKVSEDGDWARFTPDRSKLYAIQTPQGFHKEVLIHAYKQAYEEGYYGTDDCSLVEKTGKKVRLIRGSYKNIKITTPEDLIFADAIYTDRMEE